MSMKIYKFEAEGDTLYVSGSDENSARDVFNRKIGPVPRELLTITEVAKENVPTDTEIL